MKRKPVVLILTSTDERGGAAGNLAAAIRADGIHNVVVLDERKYGAAPFLPGKKGREISFLLENAVSMQPLRRRDCAAKGRAGRAAGTGA